MVKPSDALKLLLEIANFLPAGETPADFAEVFDKILRRKSDTNQNNVPALNDLLVQEVLSESRNLLEENIKQFPKFFIYMKQYQDRTAEAWIKEYDYVLHNRKMVHALLGKIYPQPDFMDIFVSHQIPTVTNVWVGDVIDFPRSLFETALDGVPPERLRICPICQSIFWAARHDARACSKKCNSVRRVRILRKKEREAPERIDAFIEEKAKAKTTL
jgi:hypothetical protein